MYKRPVPRPQFSVDRSTLTFANAENSIVYKLIHRRQIPPYKPPMHAPIVQLESYIFGLERHGATAEEIEKVRLRNYIAPTPVKAHVKPKKTKKRIVHDTDLDKVFSQFTKPAVKKKVLKAVVKKI